jgi:hypothetical protein
MVSYLQQKFRDIVGKINQASTVEHYTYVSWACMVFPQQWSIGTIYQRMPRVFHTCYTIYTWNTYLFYCRCSYQTCLLKTFELIISIFMSTSSADYGRKTGRLRGLFEFRNKDKECWSQQDKGRRQKNEKTSAWL